jgi:hypothetical protein
MPVRPPHFEPFDTERSLKNLSATGANWVALVVRGGQETIQSTDIFFKPPATATDEDIRRAIDIAHTQGTRVMLKPHVHTSLDPVHEDHYKIGTGFTSEEQWQAWFASYQRFITHYATLARDAGADMFLIGQELTGTVHREADWRRIAQEVRQIYNGPIIYEATTNRAGLVQLALADEDLQIKWWDVVDYIGVLGYFPLTDKKDPTVEELKSAWVQKGYLSRLEALSQKWQKPIIISEIGYLSKDGTNTDPVYFQKFAQAPVDLQEQADCYQAALEVLWGKSWLAGIYWWDWLVGPAVNSNEKYVTPQGKPAEDVLRKFYLSQ